MMHPQQFTTRSRDAAATVAVTAVENATLECGCEVGAHADSTLRFYVSCVEHIGGPHLILHGPFADHYIALMHVGAVRLWAEAVDSKAVWYHYGTCSAPVEDQPRCNARVVFNGDGTLRAKGGAA